MHIPFRQEDKPHPIILTFIEHLEPGSQILDLGCGTGRYALLFAKHGHHVVAIDNIQNDLDELDAQAHREHMLIEQLCQNVGQPITGQFDVVIMSQLLHQLAVTTAENLIKRMIAQTNPGGHHFLCARLTKGEFFKTHGPLGNGLYLNQNTYLRQYYTGWHIIDDEVFEARCAPNNQHRNHPKNHHLAVLLQKPL